MSSTRYEQLNVNNDNDDYIRDRVELQPKPKANWVAPIVKTLVLINIYFGLSIGLTFYQRSLLKDFPGFPLDIVLFHLIVKWIVSGIFRCFLFKSKQRSKLGFAAALKSVAPTGAASGIDVGLSNWGLALVPVSLYTMTKSTTIIFILGFAIIMGLEKKSWSLMTIVIMISSGLALFTYKATQFSVLGFVLLLLASLCSGVRWTFAQMLMQKSKLGLSNPLDMLYYVQPWMIIAVLPFAIIFEGSKMWGLIDTFSQNEWFTINVTFLRLFFGAALAFAMELSEYLVVHNTSSLTLSVAGIFKEMCILVLAVEINGDQLSIINTCGLFLCLLGIGGHVYHKSIQEVDPSAQNDNQSTEGEVQSDGPIGNSRKYSIDYNKSGQSKPLLNDAENTNFDLSDTDSERCEVDKSNQVLFDILKRRDHVHRV